MPECQHDWRTLGKSAEAWRERRCKVCGEYAWELDVLKAVTGTETIPVRFCEMTYRIICCEGKYSLHKCLDETPIAEPIIQGKNPDDITNQLMRMLIDAKQELVLTVPSVPSRATEERAANSACGPVRSVMAQEVKNREILDG